MALNESGLLGVRFSIVFMSKYLLSSTISFMLPLLAMMLAEANQDERDHSHQVKVGGVGKVNTRLSTYVVPFTILMATTLLVGASL